MAAGNKYPCPRCRKDVVLKPRYDGGCMFLACQICDGGFFEEFDLGRYVGGKLGQKAASVYLYWMLASMEKVEDARRGKRVCPICTNQLRRHPFGKQPHFVLLDRCPLHGFWLDKDEIDTILNGCREYARR